MEWNEDKYKYMEEIKKSKAHDCIGDRENCDTVHPNAAGISIALPSILRKNQNHPNHHRNWILDAKVMVGYLNKHTVKMEAFNLSEVFSQMGTNGKLNTIHMIIEHCLDDDERSMLFADLTN